jgi:hypothetical protein
MQKLELGKFNDVCFLYYIALIINFNRIDESENKKLIQKLLKL